MSVRIYPGGDGGGETDPYAPASLKYVAGRPRPTAVISDSFDTLPLVSGIV